MFENLDAILQEFNLKLATAVTVENEHCCPLGALLVKKYGSVPRASDRIRDALVVAPILAQELGLDRYWVQSFIAGFDGITPDKPVIEKAVELGQSLRKKYNCAI